MQLQELFDANWNSYERKRFLNDDTKTKTESFDPETFKHEGFDDRATFEDTYVPALADEERLEQELTTFSPPRLSAINGSPYQALVIRFGILRTLIQQPEFYMPKTNCSKRSKPGSKTLSPDLRKRISPRMTNCSTSQELQCITTPISTILS